MASNRNRMARRTFLKGAAAGVATTMAYPSLATGKAPRISPMERLNIAGIGVGGRGFSDLQAMERENIVALCDVDEKEAARAYDRWPKAQQFKDFRKFFDAMANEIDAVVIATPDHTHAVIALAAMQLGKHVYLEKPLAHSIKEVGVLQEAARRYGVATQMGNQGMAGQGVRRICELIWSGALGEVHTVHAWDDSTDMRADVHRPKDEPPVPDNLDWNLWLGPAPRRPYHPAYHPRDWRGWWDFGGGALGDMGCHLMNPANMALQLGQPDSVETVRQHGLTEESPPESSVIRYEFPARKDMRPVTLYWYDGGERPEAPGDVPQDEIDGQRYGTLYIGTEGILMGYARDATRTVLYPEERREAFDDPPEMLPRSPGHYEEFIMACKGGPNAMSHFDYAAPMTKMVLLGNIALRTGEKIRWDGERVTNIEGANELLHREYRQGWSLEI